MKMSNTTSLEDVKSGILEYIKSSDYQYSLFINGEWGIGKTHFIKGSLKSVITDSTRVVYISLFGIASIQELDEKLSTELLLQVFNKKKFYDSKLGKLCRILGKTAFNIILKNIALESKDFPSKSDWLAFLPKSKNRKILFVFDDIERTSCEMRDLLGYINNFVEQYNAKVILIGNEPKIGFTGDRNEAKPTNTASNIPNDSGDSEDRNQSIFSEYKEKLVGYKINLTPDFNAVASIIVSSLSDKLEIETNIGLTAKEIGDILISIFEEANDNNLRNFQNIIGTIGRLFQSLMDPQYVKLFPDKDYIKRFFQVSIIQLTWCKLNKKPSQNLLYANSQWTVKSNLSLSYMESFVSSSIMPQSEFKQSINEFIRIIKWEDDNKNDPLNVLRSGYHELESYEIFLELYNHLVTKLNNFEYPPFKWGDTLVLISKLETQDLAEKGAFFAAIDKIKSQVESIDWSSEEYQQFYFDVTYYTFSGKLIKEHQDALCLNFDEWGNWKNKYLEEKIGKNLQQYLKENNIDGFITYINTKQNDIFQYKRLLSLLDLVSITNFLANATPYQYQIFREAIFKIYKYFEPIDSCELFVIKQIVEWCRKNMNIGDKIVLMQRRWLLDNLEGFATNSGPS